MAGSAESLPLPDASATVVWSMSAVHHWDDRARGVGEARRVLAPGGRLLLAERRVSRSGRGRAGHGLTVEEEAQLVLDLKAAGFADAAAQTRGTGRRAFVVVSGVVPATATQ